MSALYMCADHLGDRAGRRPKRPAHARHRESTDVRRRHLEGGRCESTASHPTQQPLLHETAHALGVGYEHYLRERAEVVVDTVVFSPARLGSHWPCGAAWVTAVTDAGLGTSVRRFEVRLLRREATANLLRPCMQGSRVGAVALFPHRSSSGRRRLIRAPLPLAWNGGVNATPAGSTGDPQDQRSNRRGARARASRSACWSNITPGLATSRSFVELDHHRVGTRPRTVRHMSELPRPGRGRSTQPLLAC